MTLDGAACESTIFGAAALRHPVVHRDALTRDELTIAAVQGSAHSDLANAGEARRIDDPALRLRFAARGVLHETSRHG